MTDIIKEQDDDDTFYRRVIGRINYPDKTTKLVLECGHEIIFVIGERDTPDEAYCSACLHKMLDESKE